MFIKRTHNVKYWKVTLEIPNNIKIAPESMLVDKIFNTRSLGALGPWLLGRPANGCTNIRIEWKTLGCTHFPEICFHLPSIWHEYQDKKKIPEIWFHPPNVWHKYQDRIENVAFYAHHRNMFTPPRMFCTNIRIEWIFGLSCVFLIIAINWRRKKRTDRQIFDGGVKWKLLYNKIIVHCAVPQSQIVKFEMSIVESWQIVSDPRQYAFDTQLHYLNYTIYLSLLPI